MVTSPKSPKSPQSPKGEAAAPPAPTPPAPTPLSAEAQIAAGILPASHWTAQPLPEEDPGNDTASTIGSVTSTSASVASSIYKYRTIQGRTYHGDMGNAESWIPNDARHVDAMDILHHALVITTDGKLFLAPLEKKKIHKVLDIATGAGLWSIDFADEFPHAEVIGTDVSPIQPTWVPPNVTFELDDCNQEWTWGENTFDFVNLRFLSGIVDDWYALFRNAYRVCKPGAWVESAGGSTKFLSPDGTVKEGSAMDQWGKVFQEGGKKLGRTFAVYEEDLQRKAMEAAGFVDIQYKDIDIPLGIWHPDKKAAERGLWFKLAMEEDVEGYINYLWHAVLGWTPEEAKVFARHIKKEWNDPNIHGYFTMRIAWGRKPE